jgi:hypothetical protein
MRTDLGRLIVEGHQLLVRMMFDLDPDAVAKTRKQTEDQLKKELPAFDNNYQRWYSESLAMLSVLLPDRVADFKAHYQLPRAPKELSYSTYTISDYLKGITVTQPYTEEEIVGRKPLKRRCANNMKL